MTQTTRPKAVVLIGVVVLLVGGCTREARPSSRTFAFRYTASLTHLPAETTRVRLWIPLAKTRDNQQVLTRRIQTSRPYEIHEEPVYGNDILYLTLRAPVPQPYDVVIDYTVKVRSGRRLGPQMFFHGSESVASADDPPTSLRGAAVRSAQQRSRLRRDAHLRWATAKRWGDELTLALRHEPLMVVDETVTRLAKEAATGRAGELQKARAIYDYVIAHMRYDKTTPGWGRGDTLRACQLGAGNCTDFHSLFISMSRSLGIPARFVIGASIPTEPTGQIPGYHCWAEFYSPEHGWVPVDASEAWKHPQLREYYFGTLDPNKLLISAGRNLQLVPAQAGPPVNLFVYPYVEVDGVACDGVTTRFEFWDRNNKEGSI